jgi:hypothetical protein
VDFTERKKYATNAPETLNTRPTGVSPLPVFFTQYSEDALYDSQVTHYAWLTANIQPQTSAPPDIGR